MNSSALRGGGRPLSTVEKLRINGDDDDDDDMTRRDKPVRTDGTNAAMTEFRDPNEQNDAAAKAVANLIVQTM
jgi:hypothetical protein